MYMTKKLANKAFHGITFEDAKRGAARLGVNVDPIAEGLKKAKVKRVL